jgi:hypothetical protein
MITKITMKRVATVMFVAAIFTSLLASPAPVRATTGGVIVFDYSHGQSKAALLNTTDLWLKNNLTAMGYSVIWAVGGINASILSNAVAFIAGPMYGASKGYTTAEINAIDAWFNTGKKLMWIGYDSDYVSASSGQFILNNMTAILSGVGSHVYGEPTAVQDPYSSAGSAYRVIANRTSTDPKVASIVAGVSKVLVHSPTLLFGSNASGGAYNVTPCALESGNIHNVYPVLYYGNSAKIVDSDLIAPISHSDGQIGGFVAMTVEFEAGAAQTGVLMVAAGSPYGAYQGMNTFSYYGYPVNGNITLQAITFGITSATATTTTTTTTTTTPVVAPVDYTLYIAIGAVGVIAIILVAYIVKKK